MQNPAEVLAAESERRYREEEARGTAVAVESVFARARRWSLKRRGSACTALTHIILTQRRGWLLRAFGAGPNG